MYYFENTLQCYRLRLFASVFIFTVHFQIVDVETKEFLFYINATDPRRCNWMRYINCARYFEEQNIVSEQDGIDIFYEAIKVRLENVEICTVCCLI